MPRKAHHRADWRTGPWQIFVKRKAEYVLRLAGPGWLLERLVNTAVRVGPDTYVIRGGAGLFLKARTVLDDWRPLATDADGRVWE